MAKSFEENDWVLLPTPETLKLILDYSVTNIQDKYDQPPPITQASCAVCWLSACVDHDRVD